MRDDPRLRAAGGVGALIAAVVGFLLAREGARHAWRATKFGYRIATFTLYRRCPDCAGRLHADARMCRRCGYRLKAAP